MNQPKTIANNKARANKRDKYASAGWFSCWFSLQVDFPSTRRQVSRSVEPAPVNPASSPSQPIHNRYVDLQVTQPVNLESSPSQPIHNRYVVYVDLQIIMIKMPKMILIVMKIRSY